MYYVYLLQNEQGDVYYGSTNDLRRRLTEHNGGKSFSTRGHQWKLVYYEAYSAEKDARFREQQLKRYGQSFAHLKKRLSHSLSKN